jgi:hypothetical protein
MKRRKPIPRYPSRATYPLIIMHRAWTGAFGIIAECGSAESCRSIILYVIQTVGIMRDSGNNAAGYMESSMGIETIITVDRINSKELGCVNS